MRFLAYSIISFFGICFSTDAALALCDKYTKDQIGEDFSFIYKCRNTDKAVSYEIVSHFTERLETTFFQFDRKGWNLFCNRVTIDDLIIHNNCDAYGLKRKRHFKLRKHEFVLNFDIKPSKIKDLYNQFDDYEYIFPSHFSQYLDRGCAIFFRKNVVQLFLNNSNLEAFHDCLIRYELFRSKKS